MTVQLLPNARQQFFDTNGDPIVGGTVEMYIPNTFDPKTTYQDSDGVTPNDNPLTLDDLGSAVMWGSGSYRQIVKDKDGNLIWDDITSMGDSGGSLSPGVYTNSTVTVGDDGSIIDIETGSPGSVNLIDVNYTGGTVDAWSPTDYDDTVTGINGTSFDGGSLIINGLSGGTRGRELIIWNGGINPFISTDATITISHNASGTLGDSFYCPNAQDFVLASGCGVLLMYSGTQGEAAGRWLVISPFGNS